MGKYYGRYAFQSAQWAGCEATLSYDALMHVRAVILGFAAHSMYLQSVVARTEPRKTLYVHLLSSLNWPRTRELTEIGFTTAKVNCNACLLSLSLFS